MAPFSGSSGENNSSGEITSSPEDAARVETLDKIIGMSMLGMQRAKMGFRRKQLIRTYSCFIGSGGPCDKGRVS